MNLSSFFNTIFHDGDSFQKIVRTFIIPDN